MEEILKTETQPDVLPSAEDTTPADNPVFLTVKFNKELFDLDRDETTALAQKGMKYDRISEEYERLKNAPTLPDIAEFCEEFPELSSPDALPEKVRLAAEESRRGLLFEFLLHSYRENRAAAAEVQNRAFAANASVGSLATDDREDPAAAEFLRGVWGN